MQQNIFSVHLSPFSLVNLPICSIIASLLCRGVCIKGISWTFNLSLFYLYSVMLIWRCYAKGVYLKWCRPRGNSTK